MEIANLLTRSEVKCKDKQSQELINDWTKNEGWNFEDFAKFLKLIGIKTPVIIQKLESEKKAFKCISKVGKEYEIVLQFNDWVDFPSEIHVTNSNETIHYICSKKTVNNYLKPEVTKICRFMKENGKSLESYYGEFFCTLTLYLDECHTLTVELTEQVKGKSAVQVLKNVSKIEEYLFNLDKKLVVSEVYDQLIHLMDVTANDIKLIKEIYICFEKKVGKKEQTLGCIQLKYGKMKEYAISENGETFHIYKNGKWRYYSKQIQIKYSSSRNAYTFSVTGKKDDIAKVNPDKILTRVTDRISKLRKFMN